MNKLEQFFQILKNMGFEYVLFRTQYELKRNLGILRKKFPTNFESKQFITLENWKKSSVKFFFESREKFKFCKTQK